MGEWMTVAIFLMMGGFALYRRTKFGSWRGTTFGARIARTVGEVDSRKSAVRSVRVRVHALEDPESAVPRVGLEIRVSTFGSRQTIPLSLAREEALQLSHLLTESVR